MKQLIGVKRLLFDIHLINEVRTYLNPVNQKSLIPRHSDWHWRHRRRR